MEQKGRRSKSKRELTFGFWHLCSMMDEMDCTGASLQDVRAECWKYWKNSMSDMQVTSPGVRRTRNVSETSSHECVGCSRKCTGKRRTTLKRFSARRDRKALTKMLTSDKKTVSLVASASFRSGMNWRNIAVTKTTKYQEKKKKTETK
jgi:hypothetical protein